MTTKQDFIKEYSSYSKKELIELLYFEMDTTESLEEHINFLREEIQEHDELEAEIKKRQKAREERIEYLRHKLIPELEERRERAVTKRILAAWGIVSAVFLWISFVIGAVTSFSDFCYLIIPSIVGGGMFLFAFDGLFMFTFQKNIQDRHNIDKYEHEALLLQIYRTTYFI